MSDKNLVERLKEYKHRLETMKKNATNTTENLKGVTPLPSALVHGSLNTAATESKTYDRVLQLLKAYAPEVCDE